MNARERLALMIRTDRGDMTVWSETHAQAALDAYLAEVRAATIPEVATVVVAALGDGPLPDCAPDVRAVLREAIDTASSPASSPRWSPALTAADRQNALLDAIRQDPHRRWKSGHARDVLRKQGWPVSKGTTGGDLARLAEAGHLVLHEEPNARWYSLADRGGAS
ncbi:hypothetical protein ABZX40_13210 [Streptomyces sp. NPDC004610]|uniref:hypothetical protein n=1 Tax=unclassified Streptomyces TaxID=2593676 RepID=UPI0033B4C724